MHRAEFASHIDHTVLGPETTWADVVAVLDAALEHGMNACVPPAYTSEAASYVPTVTVVTVCGFPHGQEAPPTKEFEAERAWRDGADEIDVVVNVGRLQAGETDVVAEELERVTAAVPLPVKVIVEAPLLTRDELRTVCEIAEDVGAAYVKTATGFSVGGATVEDVRVMAEYLPVKASGGVGTFEEAVEMLEAGAERIGASSGVDIVEGFDRERLEGVDVDRSGVAGPQGDGDVDDQLEDQSVDDQLEDQDDDQLEDQDDDQLEDQDDDGHDREESDSRHVEEDR